MFPEHGHLTGSRRAIVSSEPSSPKKTQMELIVEIISQCADENDDVVQLQVSLHYFGVDVLNTALPAGC
jgi:hypothetical protein